MTHVQIFQELIGIELPIIQAPMAGVQGSALAIAVSNAGGLGSLPCAMLSPDALRTELQALTAATSRPFNVNFFCHAAPASDPERERGWRKALQRYYDELGIDVADAPAAPGREAFSNDVADVLSEFTPRVVSFHFGLPSADLLARVRALGARVLSSATTVDEARWLEQHGVDAIIAQGLEAGGHRGMFLSNDITTQMGTLSLVRQVVDSVSVPVIAAGGIADAFHDGDTGSVNVDGIVHQSPGLARIDTNLALTAHEVQGIVMDQRGEFVNVADWSSGRR